MRAVWLGGSRRRHGRRPRPGAHDEEAAGGLDQLDGAEEVEGDASDGKLAAGQFVAGADGAALKDQRQPRRDLGPGRGEDEADGQKHTRAWGAVGLDGCAVEPT